MTRVQMIAAACLFLSGLLIGLVLRSGGPDIDAIDAAVAARIDALGARMEAADAEQEATLAALETQLATLGERLGPVESSARAGAEAVGGAADRIGADIEELAGSIVDTIRNATASQLSALENGIAAMRAAPASGVQDESETEAPAETVTIAPQPSAAPAPAPLRLGLGGSADLADGEVRIFVSRIDPVAGMAMLTVNDHVAELGIGESTEAPADGAVCEITLDDIDRSEAVLTSRCAAP